jgi:hypothetical protein
MARGKFGIIPDGTAMAGYIQAFGTRQREIFDVRAVLDFANGAGLYLNSLVGGPRAVTTIGTAYPRRAGVPPRLGDKPRQEGNAIIMIRFLAAALLLTAPAFAQIDFSGSWSPLYHEDLPDRIPGPELGDYLGLPLNEAARLRADSYDADRISVVPEYQCRPHSSDYSMRGLANMRVDVIRDPVTQRFIAFHTRINFQEMERTIWLDGRPHPSEYAPHTWQGFSTATWDDNMLDIYTTHLKESYLKRNGVPRSDQATFTEHWVRHGNYLTVATVVTDPVFLTEPLVRTQTWVLDPAQVIARDICETVAETPKAADYVPNHLPGTNPFLHEVADWYGLPYDATRGGAETLYPEYRKKMGKPEHPRDRCERYCSCGAEGQVCLSPTAAPPTR